MIKFKCKGKIRKQFVKFVNTKSFKFKNIGIKFKGKEN